MTAASLAGRTILITRSAGQSSEFRERLESRGARVLEVSTIEIQARPDAEIDPLAKRAAAFDWLLFTSTNAVRIFLDRCKAVGSLGSLLSQQTGNVKQRNPGQEPGRRPRICSVGPATQKAIEDYGLAVALVPDEFRAEGVLAAFSKRAGDLKAQRILFPVAGKARAILPEGLRTLGADVLLLPVYDTVPPKESARELREQLSRTTPDLVAVTSSSTARNFVSLCEPDIEPRRFAFASIGPITAKTCRQLGLDVAVEAPVSTIPGLVDAITEFFA